MAEARVERRLAAILAADVAGYSRLMGADEEGTLAALKAHRSELVDPKIAEHRGRVVKTTGDGALVEFASAVDAMRCAMEIQNRMAVRNADVPAERRIEFRIGINVGDIIIDEGDIYGDGVNIAARLEAVAEPGGVAVSDDTYRQVKGKLDATFEDAGEQQLKNIEKPVQIFRLRPDATLRTAAPAAALPDKPSIAVLPFRNLSGDPAQEYFSDGVSDDIITELSRNPWLFVIARNSGFAFKGDAVDVKRVGRELGVRYVVEGSVRRSVERLRVVAQLVDTEAGRQVWAERYDRPIGELFDLQDEITQAVVGTLVPALGTAERERAHRKPPQSLGAWEAYQRGLWHYHRPYNADDQAEARRLFDRAIQLDPGFADPHAMLGLFGFYAVLLGGAALPQETLAEAERAAEKAVELESTNALAHVALGRIRSVLRDHEAAIAEGKAAVALNPNLAVAHYALACALAYAGNGEEALPSFDRAIQLSPNDPSRWSFFYMKSTTLLQLRRYEEALIASRTAERLRPSAFLPHANSAAALAGLDRLSEASKAIAEARSRNPTLTMAFFTSGPQQYSVFAFPHLVELLCKAGLTE